MINSQFYFISPFVHGLRIRGRSNFLTSEESNRELISTGWSRDGVLGSRGTQGQTQGQGVTRHGRHRKIKPKNVAFKTALSMLICRASCPFIYLSGISAALKKIP